MATGLLQDVAAIGIPDPVKGTALVCLGIARASVEPSAEARATLSQAVIQGLGAAFKPQHIVFVQDLPRTRNMKVMRRVARAVWLGQSPGDLSTLVNPESLQALAAAARAQA